MDTCCNSKTKLRVEVAGLSNACPVLQEDVYLESTVLDGTDLVSTLSDGTIITTDLSSLDNKIESFELVGGNVLQIVRTDGTVFNVDVSSLQSPYPTNNTLSLNGNTLTSTITLSDGTVLDSEVILDLDQCNIEYEEQNCYSQSDRVLQVGNGGCPYSAPAPKGNFENPQNSDVHIACDGTITSKSPTLVDNGNGTATFTNVDGSTINLVTA